jgi:transketolase
MKKLDTRSKYLRKLIIDLFVLGQKSGGGGHFGGAFSLVEILRVIYDEFAKFKPNFPKWDNRDRIILSKGHGCLALYAILYDKGFLKKKEFLSYGKQFSILGGHPEHHIKGVEASTGSLGHGFPIGVGISLAAKMRKKNFKTIIIVGDGELNEGSNWEAAMTAEKHSLNNLIILIDYNKFQSYGYLKKVSGLNTLDKKFKSFGFKTQEIDGHNLNQIRRALKNSFKEKKKPNVIICNTIKGKGYLEAENNPAWHYVKKVSPEVAKKILEKIR